MTDDPLACAEMDARENAKAIDNFAVYDAGGGYEYTRTRDEAETIRREIKSHAGQGFPVRVAELGDDAEGDEDSSSESEGQTDA